MESSQFKVFSDITNEKNESLFTELMRLSKNNLDRAIELYFEMVSAESNSISTNKRKEPSSSSSYTCIYLGKIITEAISLTFLNNIPKGHIFHCKISKSKPKKKEDIDKTIRLSLDSDSLSVAKINSSLSEKIFSLFSADLIKLEVINLKNLRVNTLDNFQIIISVYLSPLILSDPNLNTNEEAALKKMSIEEYCTQRDAFKALLSLIKLPKTQNSLIAKDSPIDVEPDDLSEIEKSQCLNQFDEISLRETIPNSTFKSQLLKYQAQALTWMIERETKEETFNDQLHYLWEEYCTENNQKIYVNSCTGQVSIVYPSAGVLCKGGILADEMGLGKTVMTIALIHSNRAPERLACKQVKVMNQGGTLIVVPLSLVIQWKNEIEAHGDDICVLEYCENKNRTLAEVRKADVVITTYGIINSESVKKTKILWDMCWHRIILDEAHTIRNRNTTTAKSIFSLKADHKWVLTGTPIQNTIDDLFSLVRFLEYEPWNDYTWWKKIITQKFQKKSPDCFNILHRLLKPIMLRRTKSSKQENGEPILSLPPFQMNEISLKLSENYRKQYNELVTATKSEFNTIYTSGLKTYVTCVFELLLRLRQFCDHPLLLKSRCKVESVEVLEKFFKKFENSVNKNYLNEFIENVKNGSDFDCPICFEPAEDSVVTKCLHIFCRNCAMIQINKNHNCPICKSKLNTFDLQTLPRESKFSLNISENYTESIKITYLLYLLSQNTEKTVVFTQWVSMLDILEIALERNNISYSRIDGSLPKQQRENRLQEFKTHTRILIMSLKVGCQGLNLTCASQIVILDPWWNPAVEKQAIERVHRIGQIKDVRAYRIICEGTVEEQIIKLQKNKEQVIDGAFTEQTCSLNLENIRKIFDSL